MAVRTAAIRLVNINGVGSIIYKEDKIAQVMNSSSAMRVFEAEPGSAPNAAVDRARTAPTIHEYLNLEDADSFNLLHLDQTFIVTSDA